MKATVTLDTPVKRGEKEITEVVLRKPNSGEIRGVALVDLMQMDVAALIRVLPRITAPSLTEQEVSRMDPADLMQMGQEVSGFLLPKAAKQALAPQTSDSPEE
ncbi:MAG: phage tail assembly protein [Gammaproteobacteria bacterium]|nr:phage tail assembly protein [Gammaproteobacteria bacterium]